MDQIINERGTEQLERKQHSNANDGPNLTYAYVDQLSSSMPYSKELLAARSTRGRGGPSCPAPKKSGTFFH